MTALELALLVVGAVVAAALLSLVLRERGRSRRGQERRGEQTERELNAVVALSSRLQGAEDAEAVASLLATEVAEVLRAAFVAVATADLAEGRIRGLVARGADELEDWWPQVEVVFDDGPSAMAEAARRAEVVQIDDVSTSDLVNRGLAERVGARSAAFVPIIAEGHVHAVLVVAFAERRPFAEEEIALLRALGAEAALALERIASQRALAGALERERLIARVGQRVRSELDVDAVMRVAVEELAAAVGVDRAFIRLGGEGESMPVLAEWDAPGVDPVGADASVLPVLNLAARERRQVAVADIDDAPELADPSLGDVTALRRLGTRSVLASPIVAFDRMIGVVGLHRSTAGPWSTEEAFLAAAVAREAALAIHSASLREEDRRRVEQQAALLEAAAVLTGELRVETVLHRLVVELAKLLPADATDLYVWDAGHNSLRCVAVHGLPDDVLGWELQPDAGLSGRALATGRTMTSDEYETVEPAVRHPAYEGFAAGIAAPLVWSGEIRGVVGAGVKDPARRFSAGDAQVLETFAGLAALALGNAESFERSERQARVERSFFRIATLLGEPVARAQTYDAVAHAACEAFGAALGAVLIPIADGFELAGSHELPEHEAPVFQQQLGGARALVAAIRAGRLLASPDLGGDDRFPERFRELAGSLGYRSLVSIPFELPRPNERGVVLIVFREVRELSDDDVELARHLGGAARGALERSELFEREQTSRTLAQQLARTGGLLAAELDPAALLTELAEEAPGLLDADGAAIAVIEGDDLVTAAAAGAGSEDAVGARIAIAGTPAGDVIQARAPLAVADAASAGVAPEDDALVAAGYRAFLGVPLYASEGDLRGTLAVYSRTPREWRTEEIEALVALAGNAAAMLANAELYQRVAIEKERLDAILGGVADGIVAVDGDGRIVLWNRAAERITGVPQTEAYGQQLVRVLQRDLTGVSTGTGDRLVHISRGADQVWLSVSEAVMSDAAGGVAGRVFAFRDVSSERIVEQMKTAFVSTVSQELRRPLTSIYGFAETLLRRDVDFADEDRRRFLGFIASEAERLTAIVDQLLSVARLDAGDLQVDLAPTDVRGVVEDVVEALSGAETLNGHHFELRLPDEPLDASVDREKLIQVLDALVDNAVKYSPHGGTITLAARRRSDAVEVRVADEGVGIAPDEHERIFSKFYRSEGAPPGGGTGLGLFIAQGLLAAMGGRIWVDSSSGDGATFVFELPVAAGRSPVARA